MTICDDLIGNTDTRALCKKKRNKLIISHLSIKTLRNKLDFHKELMQDNRYSDDI